MFDKVKFSEIIKKISETYESQREFATLSDINRTYLSQYMNMKLDDPPKPKTLQKLANSSNGIITYPELMEICGYFEYSELKDFYAQNYNVSPETFYEAMGENLYIGLDKQTSYVLTKMFEDMNVNDKKYQTNGKFDINKYLSNVDDAIRQEIINRYTKMRKAQNSIFSSVIQVEKALEKNNAQNNNSAIVFVYGTIPAGIPMECIEDIIDTEEISADMLKGGKQYFGLCVKGDSMFPEYLDGDTLIIEKVEDCENGQDCIIMVNGSDGTFKRVFKNENGIILQPLNPTFSPMVYSNEDIEKLPIRIIGRVVELRRKK